MRLANLDGQPVVVDGDTAIALDDRVPPGADRFRTVIEQWPERTSPAALDAAPRRPIGGRALGPPMPRPGKIIGAPVNYRDHQREMQAEHTIAGLGFFLKSPTSIVGPDGAVPLPFAGRRTDQEAELGVVIGRAATDVSSVDALDHVFGYTCLVDVTVRGPEERSTRKSFPGFTPIGPWITTADELEDPTDLSIRGWVNDELRQDASTADMIYPVAELIELVSSVVTLEPGDLIATGTPAGVGPIVPGDVIRVAIEGIGELEIPVVSAGRDPHPLWLRGDTG